jgi:cytidylate kinase
MSQVIVVTGPPGSGKSTVAERLALHFDPSALVPGDDFFGFLRVGAIDPWLEEAAEQNEAVIESAAASLGPLALRCEVVYEGVLGPSYLPNFIRRAGVGSVHYAVLLPPLAVCLERVQTRTAHGFADLDAAEHMWNDFQRGIVGLERHLVDGLADPGDVARTIAQDVADGGLLYPSAGSVP